MHEFGILKREIALLEKITDRARLGTEIPRL
jgi:hypothetical protein